MAIAVLHAGLLWVTEELHTLGVPSLFCKVSEGGGDGRRRRGVWNRTHLHSLSPRSYDNYIFMSGREIVLSAMEDRVAVWREWLHSGLTVG